ncbi:MAG: hypothetical protein E7637_04655 [Ruminococcaceae bacterium]|nr:hypothetical protein [Oscillospiraceae bacterium]
MKKILSLLLCMALLLTVCSCAKEKYDLLYEVSYDGITYCVRGSGSRAKQIVVKNGDSVLWQKKVKVSKRIGNKNETYGFYAEDLNFDGHRDLRIATAVTEDCVSYACFLYNPATQEYVSNKELNELYNVQPNPEQQGILGFTHTVVTDKNADTTITDATTLYVWESGKLIPYMRISLAYHSADRQYNSCVSYYNRELGTFFDDYTKESWMTPEEYQKEFQSHGFSGLYYFK